MATIAFCLFSIVMAALQIGTIYKAANKKFWLIVFYLNLIFFSFASISGLVVRYFVPIGPLLFLCTFALAFTFSFGKSGLDVCKSSSFTSLLFFQSFRLPLEVILHYWGQLGIVPIEMTWSGQNFDVIAGIIGLVSPLLLKMQPARIAFILNTICFLLLLNVIRVVLLSSLLPFSWPLDKPLLLLAYFPHCLIVPLFVLPAFIGHLLTFRKINLELTNLQKSQDGTNGILSSVKPN